MRGGEKESYRREFRLLRLKKLEAMRAGDVILAASFDASMNAMRRGVNSLHHARIVASHQKPSSQKAGSVRPLPSPKLIGTCRVDAQRLNNGAVQ